MPESHAYLSTALGVAAAAAFFDWRRGRVPNALTYGAFALAPFVRASVEISRGADAGDAAVAVAASFGGAVLCALVPLVMYRTGAIGGGDVKLLAAIGALLAPTAGFEAETYGFIVLAACIPLKLTFDGKLLVTTKGALVLVFNALAPARMRRPVPTTLFGSFRLAPALFVGVLLVARERW